MSTYLIRRLLQSVVILILVTFAIFAGIRYLPGDPVFVLVSPTQQQRFTKEQLDQIRHDAGLDKPVIEQYVIWLGKVVKGDLGKSVIYQTRVSDELASRLPITLHLGIIAIVLGIIIGIPLGIIAAVRRGTWLDTVVTSIANIGVTMPVFWLGVCLVYILGLRLHLLPVMGYTSPFEDFWMSTKQLIMPLFCLAIWPIAGNARQIRSVMLEVLRQDYIRTAWSKGLTEQVIIIKHALKNGFIPILSFIGLGVPMIIGGEVLVEMVFNIPGIGRLAVESIYKLDYAFVEGVVLVIAIAVVLTNVLIDLAYGWLDPRIRYD